jgi:hypothetical protein
MADTHRRGGPGSGARQHIAGIIAGGTDEGIDRGALAGGAVPS